MQFQSSEMEFAYFFSLLRMNSKHQLVEKTGRGIVKFIYSDRRGSRLIFAVYRTNDSCIALFCFDDIDLVNLSFIFCFFFCDIVDRLNRKG